MGNQADTSRSDTKTKLTESQADNDFSTSGQADQDFVFSFPKELSLLLFSFLPSLSDVARATMVSKSWYSLINQPILWSDYEDGTCDEALGKRKVRQSSYEHKSHGDSYPAYNAVDGSLTSYIMTSASDTLPATFEIDLEESISISNIKLYNNLNIPHLLRDITVAVFLNNYNSGDIRDLSQAVWTSPLLNPKNILSSPSIIDISVPNISGSVVRIQRTPEFGTTNVLSFTKIEIFREGHKNKMKKIDVAIGKIGRMSSEWDIFPPSLSLDGHRHTFSHTIQNVNLPSTFEVDLGEIMCITNITIVNREGYHHRLRNITFSILNEKTSDVRDIKNSIWKSKEINKKGKKKPTDDNFLTISVKLPNFGIFPGVPGRFMKIQRRPVKMRTGNGDDDDSLNIAQIIIYTKIFMGNTPRSVSN